MILQDLLPGSDLQHVLQLLARLHAVHLALALAPLLHFVHPWALEAIETSRLHLQPRLLVPSLLILLLGRIASHHHRALVASQDLVVAQRLEDLRDTWVEAELHHSATVTVVQNRLGEQHRVDPA